MSSGLAKRASATVVDRPCAASSSAAFRHSASRVPSDSSATVRALAHDPALADLERHAALGHVDADAVAARIAERDGRSSIADLGRHHVHQFGLVGRRHDHEARQAAEIGDVERAGMGRAVGADQAGAVDARSAPAGSGSRRRARPGRRRAAGRSNRSRRTACSPRSASPAAKVTACCSAMPTSKVRFGKRLAEQVEPGAGRHRGGDGDDARRPSRPP